MRQMEQWRCKHGHILGFIRWNGEHVPQLMLLRAALDMQAVRPEDVDLVGPLTGSMDVRCSICESVRPWKITIKAMIWLFEGLDDKEAFDLWVELLEKAKGPAPLSGPPVAEATSPQMPLRGHLGGKKEEVE